MITAVAPGKQVDDTKKHVVSDIICAHRKPLYVVKSACDSLSPFSLLSEGKGREKSTICPTHTHQGYHRTAFLAAGILH